MAQQQFTLLNNVVLSSAGIPGNGVHDLYVSGTQSNNNGLPNCRLVVEYTELAPIELLGGITAVIEAMNGGRWFPIAYQFEPFRNMDQGTQRIIHLGQTIDTYNDGIDSIVYVGGRTIARISRQQGRATSSFRVRLQLEETAFGMANAFQSVRASIYGEVFDAAG
jgi:hypothetical protein